MSYCFISDLHLHEDRPDITEAFLNFLEETASKSERLYILGDLFEVWIGDDLQNDFIIKIRDALKETNKSTEIFLMHGNRDFLIGPAFLSSSGMKLLTDPYTEEMFGKSVSLMHGDLLCTDDVDYQSFRKTSRDRKWQQEFLGKSLKERQRIAKDLRDISKKATSEKKEEIMDVTPSEVLNTMERSAVNLLIHGHTHRPDSHDVQVNNQPAKRMVLGDWDQYGWYIWMDSDSCELNRFTIS